MKTRLRSLLQVGLLFWLPSLWAAPIVESRTVAPPIPSPATVEQPLSAPEAPAATRIMPNRPTTSAPRMGATDPLRAQQQQIEGLKEELIELRGALEKQAYELKEQMQRLKKSQQDFYVDLDKRLNDLGGAKKAQAPLAKQALNGTDSKSASMIGDEGSRTLNIMDPKGKTSMVMRDEPADALSADLSQQRQGPLSTDLSQPQQELLSAALSEKEIYDLATSRLSTKQMPEAIAGFQAYLDRYPQGQYVVQCYYWLGEAYMAEWGAHKQNKGLLDKAINAFTVLTTQFPTHQRATDALLKLGMIEQEKGDLKRSKQYFQQVKERYPDSAAARLAEVYLEGDE